MTGAAVLVGRGALHSGAGLVRVACPACVQDVVATGHPCYTTFGIRQHADGEADLEREARDREQERDLRSHEADELLARHHYFAQAMALFQVAIALGAVAALTRLRSVWIGSMLLGAAGIALFARPFV